MTVAHSPTAPAREPTLMTILWIVHSRKWQQSRLPPSGSESVREPGVDFADAVLP